ncbi:MAG: D-aminoacyl-tRNA deacylase [Paludibacteraceae bacterium]|jgi:D-tyrosyl-tRNA(Tyr) deacylase|nr:D-aminoacyl-tRNA deacylase [Paludibacteraceae bacterium]
MRVVIQRVTFAKVEVDKKVVGEIEKGMMILVGFENEDTDEDLTWMAGKITALRIFDDEQGVMNKSIIDADGDILCISQFTLHAQTKKGNRPSYIKAAKGEIAEPLYQDFCNKLKNNLNKEIQKGIFGADMKVSLLNDGPVTICIDSKNKQ